MLIASEFNPVLATRAAKMEPGADNRGESSSRRHRDVDPFGRTTGSVSSGLSSSREAWSTKRTEFHDFAMKSSGERAETSPEGGISLAVRGGLPPLRGIDGVLGEAAR